MFGEDSNLKGKPVKGYRFLVFTFLMIIALTTMVIINTGEMHKNQLELVDKARGTKTTTDAITGDKDSTTKPVEGGETKTEEPAKVTDTKDESSKTPLEKENTTPVTEENKDSTTTKDTTEES